VLNFYRIILGNTAINTYCRKKANENRNRGADNEF